MPGANRGGELQDRSLQGVSERQGLFDGVQEAGLQYGQQYKCGAMQTEDWQNASDKSALAVFG